MAVRWSRGRRVAASPPAEYCFIDCAVEWHAALAMAASLYAKPDGSAFDAKVYRMELVEMPTPRRKGKGRQSAHPPAPSKPVVLATAELDLAEYASVVLTEPHTSPQPVRRSLTLKPKSANIASAVLEFTVAAARASSPPESADTNVEDREVVAAQASLPTPMPTPAVDAALAAQADADETSSADAGSCGSSSASSSSSSSYEESYESSSSSGLAPSPPPVPSTVSLIDVQADRRAKYPTLARNALDEVELASMAPETGNSGLAVGLAAELATPSRSQASVLESVLKVQLGESWTARRELESEVEALTAELTEKNAALTQLRAQLMRVQRQVRSAKALQAVEAEHEAEALAPMRSALDGANTRVAKLTTELSSARARIAVLESKREGGPSGPGGKDRSSRRLRAKLRERMLETARLEAEVGVRDERIAQLEAALQSRAAEPVPTPAPAAALAVAPIPETDELARLRAENEALRKVVPMYTPSVGSVDLPREMVDGETEAEVRLHALETLLQASVDEQAAAVAEANEVRANWVALKIQCAEADCGRR
ncbi:uncharacterized protein AMSG_07787 [Thecamonas trahens ATCC 50062]|uniref:C2 NT-type domain-containing protein n=1 Tax=Thecamonas trahens ATCC 50062 TaxID=461836 RepID=A0A0L0DHC8_THETB|nr:hypothetical protein AMSG_07787 [Thecamonas trahens ATCC 50062]KNC51717.1 hypothetical protein AMSG_07787 [Thecamonas trahens ATCC 50062]|eukprot:XP_013755846.1 hypothetical protein AMSG_07787 [Thecamonas trahens ATCC 50062]